MKTFQPRTVEQQRKNYIKACKQRMARELEELKENYREEHWNHAKLFQKASMIEDQIAKTQDRIANAADKEFGGWNVWRHNEALLKAVVARMEEAVADHRVRIGALNKRMDKCLAEYREKCEAVTRKYYLLIKTA